MLKIFQTFPTPTALRYESVKEVNVETECYRSFDVNIDLESLAAATKNEDLHECFVYTRKFEVILHAIAQVEEPTVGAKKANFKALEVGKESYTLSEDSGPLLVSDFLKRDLGLGKKQRNKLTHNCERIIHYVSEAQKVQIGNLEATPSEGNEESRPVLNVVQNSDNARITKEIIDQKLKEKVENVKAIVYNKIVLTTDDIPEGETDLEGLSEEEWEVYEEKITPIANDFLQGILEDINK